MDFRTIVHIDKPTFAIQPCERMLFVGSCFAENIGKRFEEERFHTTINPFGVMYNPASVLHTVAKTDAVARVAVVTLGTNHVYRLRETGDIVDNCEKRPARLFVEEELTVDACVGYLSQAVELLQSRDSQVRVIVTVSPIRYAKYGYPKSQLSKATLLLAAHELVKRHPSVVTYFPAYEIMNDELRDYRFYRADMLHPSDQAVEYFWQRFSETIFAPETHRFIEEWEPVKKALAHKPFHPEALEYKMLMEKTRQRITEMKSRYPAFESPL